MASLPPTALYAVKPTENFVGSEREIEKSFLRLEHVPGYNNSIFANVDIPPNTKLMVYPGFVYAPNMLPPNTSTKASRYSWEMKMAVPSPNNPGKEIVVDGYEVSAGTQEGHVHKEFAKFFAPYVNEGTNDEINVIPVMNFTRPEGQALEYWSHHKKRIKKNDQLFVCYSRLETNETTGTAIKRCNPALSPTRYIYGSSPMPRSRPGLGRPPYLTKSTTKRQRGSNVASLPYNPIQHSSLQTLGTRILENDNVTTLFITQDVIRSKAGEAEAATVARTTGYPHHRTIAISTRYSLVIGYDTQHLLLYAFVKSANNYVSVVYLYNVTTKQCTVHEFVGRPSDHFRLGHPKKYMTQNFPALFGTHYHGPLLDFMSSTN